MTRPLLVGLVVLLWATPGLAQPPEVPEPRERIERVEVGGRVPWTGLLVEEALLVDWRLRIELLEHRLTLEAEAATERAIARQDAYSARLEIEGERRQLEVGLWQGKARELGAALQAAQADAGLGFFEWLAIGATGAVLCTAALALGTLL